MSSGTIGRNERCENHGVFRRKQGRRLIDESGTLSRTALVVEPGVLVSRGLV
jgi:hypothetical protein